MLPKETKIMIIGGHLTPALAVQSILLQNGYSNLVWVGTRKSQTSDSTDSAEFTTINEKGIKFIDFRAGKIWRKWTPATFGKGLMNLILIPLGFLNAFRIVFFESPQVVLSFGGYLALPIVFAAKFRRSRIFTHEQTVKVGLANKLIAKFADKVFYSWDKTLDYLPKNKAIKTGNPIRYEVLHPGTTDKFVFPVGLPLIYVTGGNQGANTINWRLMELLPKLLERANVFHQTGHSALTQDFEKAIAYKKTLSKDMSKRYYVCDSVFGLEIGEIFQKADIIISRAGANTVTEILALGKLSILIPIPWSSDDEQLENAKLVESTGLALVMKQYDAMPPSELQEAIDIALDYHSRGQAFNETGLLKAKLIAKNLVNVNAAELIFTEITKDPE